MDMSFKDQSPTVPLASNGHPPPDVESTADATAVITDRPPKKKNRTKCLLSILLFIIFQTAVILVFVLVIMKVQGPTFRLRSAELANREATNGSFTGKITAEVSIGNNNFGKYKYGDTRVQFHYKGLEIGAGEVRGSSVNWKSTRKVEMRAVVSMELVGDEGMVRVESRGRVEGRVALVFVFKRKTSTDMDCAMDLVTASGQITNIVCQ